MVDFDSDYLRLPLVPFIIELPDRCFLVKVPLCLAAQREYLPHFELIEISIQNPKNKNERLIKPIGHKAREFLATCSAFILVADDGYQIKVEPRINWHFERPEANEYPCFSLDEEPADDIEAFDIYEEYIDRKMSGKLNKVTELLATNQISIDHLKYEKPDYDLTGFIDYYQNAKVLFKGFDKIAFGEALIKNALNKNPIVRQEKRLKVKNLDLLVSYHWIMNSYPGISQEAGRKKAIKLKSPKISGDDLERSSNALKEHIKEHDKDEALRFLFPFDQD